MIVILKQNAKKPSVDPVSYTHLDVYKRQLPAWAGDREAVPATPAEFPACQTAARPPDGHFADRGGLVCSPEAVSYTHLDVYKRQP